LGIVILTNNDNQNFFEALRYQILDAYLNVPYINRSRQQMQYFKPDFDKSINDIKQMQARVKGAKSSLPLSAYTGTYVNELYGPVEITAEENDLKITFKGHNKLTAKLQYMDHDEWLMTYNHIAYGIFPLRFKMSGNKVVSVDIKASDFVEFDPYTFIKE
jgi:hypothetical protein